MIVNKDTVLISSHVVLGVLLVLFALHKIYYLAKKQNRMERIWNFLVAAVSVLLGLVFFTTSDEPGVLIFTLGTFMVAYGVISMARSIYQTGLKRQ